MGGPRTSYMDLANHAASMGFTREEFEAFTTQRFGIDSALLAQHGRDPSTMMLPVGVGDMADSRGEVSSPDALDPTGGQLYRSLRPDVRLTPSGLQDGPVGPIPGPQVPPSQAEETLGAGIPPTFEAAMASPPAVVKRAAADRLSEAGERFDAGDFDGAMALVKEEGLRSELPQSYLEIGNPFFGKDEPPRMVSLPVADPLPARSAQWDGVVDTAHAMKTGHHPRAGFPESPEPVGGGISDAMERQMARGGGYIGGGALGVIDLVAAGSAKLVSEASRAQLERKGGELTDFDRMADAWWKQSTDRISMAIESYSDVLRSRQDLDAITQSRLSISDIQTAMGHILAGALGFEVSPAQIGEMSKGELFLKSVEVGEAVGMSAVDGGLAAFAVLVTDPELAAADPPAVLMAMAPVVWGLNRVGRLSAHPAARAVASWVMEKSGEAGAAMGLKDVPSLIPTAVSESLSGLGNLMGSSVTYMANAITRTFDNASAMRLRQAEMFDDAVRRLPGAQQEAMRQLAIAVAEREAPRLAAAAEETNALARAAREAQRTDFDPAQPFVDAVRAWMEAEAKAWWDSENPGPAPPPYTVVEPRRLESVRVTAGPESRPSWTAPGGVGSLDPAAAKLQSLSMTAMGQMWAVFKEKMPEVAASVTPEQFFGQQLEAYPVELMTVEGIVEGAREAGMAPTRYVATRLGEWAKDAFALEDLPGEVQLGLPGPGRSTLDAPTSGGWPMWKEALDSFVDGVVALDPATDGPGLRASAAEARRQSLIAHAADMRSLMEEAASRGDEATYREASFAWRQADRHIRRLADDPAGAEAAIRAEGNIEQGFQTLIDDTEAVAFEDPSAVVPTDVIPGLRRGRRAASEIPPPTGSGLSGKPARGWWPVLSAFDLEQMGRDAIGRPMDIKGAKDHFATVDRQVAKATTKEAAQLVLDEVGRLNDLIDRAEAERIAAADIEAARRGEIEANAMVADPGGRRLHEAELRSIRDSLDFLGHDVDIDLSKLSPRQAQALREALDRRVAESFDMEPPQAGRFTGPRLEAPSGPSNITEGSRRHPVVTVRATIDGAGKVHMVRESVRPGHRETYKIAPVDGRTRRMLKEFEESGAINATDKEVLMAFSDEMDTAGLNVLAGSKLARSAGANAVAKRLTDLGVMPDEAKRVAEVLVNDMASRSESGLLETSQVPDVMLKIKGRTINLRKQVIRGALSALKRDQLAVVFEQSIKAAAERKGHTSALRTRRESAVGALGGEDIVTSAVDPAAHALDVFNSWRAGEAVALRRIPADQIVARLVEAGIEVPKGFKAYLQGASEFGTPTGLGKGRWGEAEATPQVLEWLGLKEVAEGSVRRVRHDVVPLEGKLYMPAPLLRNLERIARQEAFYDSGSLARSVGRMGRASMTAHNTSVWGKAVLSNGMVQAVSRPGWNPLSPLKTGVRYRRWRAGELGDPKVATGRNGSTQLSDLVGDDAGIFQGLAEAGGLGTDIGTSELAGRTTNLVDRLFDLPIYSGQRRFFRYADDLFKVDEGVLSYKDAVDGLRPGHKVGLRQSPSTVSVLEVADDGTVSMTKPDGTVTSKIEEVRLHISRAAMNDGYDKFGNFSDPANLAREINSSSAGSFVTTFASPWSGWYLKMAPLFKRGLAARAMSPSPNFIPMNAAALAPRLASETARALARAFMLNGVRESFRNAGEEKIRTAFGRTSSDVTAAVLLPMADTRYIRAWNMDSISMFQPLEATLSALGGLRAAMQPDEFAGQIGLAIEQAGLGKGFDFMLEDEESAPDPQSARARNAIRNRSRQVLEYQHGPGSLRPEKVLDLFAMGGSVAASMIAEVILEKERGVPSGHGKTAAELAGEAASLFFGGTVIKGSTGVVDIAMEAVGEPPVFNRKNVPIDGDMEARVEPALRWFFMNMTGAGARAVKVEGSGDDFFRMYGGALDRHNKDKKRLLLAEARAYFENLGRDKRTQGKIDMESEDPDVRARGEQLMDEAAALSNGYAQAEAYIKRIMVDEELVQYDALRSIGVDVGKHAKSLGTVVPGKPDALGGTFYGPQQFNRALKSEKSE
jgi:hypothetical protein